MRQKNEMMDTVVRTVTTPKLGPTQLLIQGTGRYLLERKAARK